MPAIPNKIDFQSLSNYPHQAFQRIRQTTNSITSNYIGFKRGALPRSPRAPFPRGHKSITIKRASPFSLVVRKSPETGGPTRRGNRPARYYSVRRAIARLSRDERSACISPIDRDGHVISISWSIHEIPKDRRPSKLTFNLRGSARIYDGTQHVTIEYYRRYQRQGRRRIVDGEIMVFCVANFAPIHVVENTLTRDTAAAINIRTLNIEILLQFCEKVTNSGLFQRPEASTFRVQFCF